MSTLLTQLPASVKIVDLAPRHEALLNKKFLITATKELN